MFTIIYPPISSANINNPIPQYVSFLLSFLLLINFKEQDNKYKFWNEFTKEIT